MYKVFRNKSILRLTDNIIMPIDLQNSDYQQYLKWIEEGNTPEVTDELLPGLPDNLDLLIPESQVQQLSQLEVVEITVNPEPITLKV